VVATLPKEIDDLIMTAVAVRTEDRFKDAAEMRKFVQSLRSKESNREDFIRYLRYLYPKVDFNAPPLPEYGDQFQQDAEKSVIIATSREGAMSVFGRGELPIEWTTQIDAAELQAAFAKYRDRDRGDRGGRGDRGDRGGRRDFERDVTTDASIDAPRPDVSGSVEATWVRSRAATPDRRAGKSLDHTPTQIAEIQDIGQAETKYTRSPTGVDRDTQHLQPALGTSRVAHQFRDDEMTVMMESPPRTLGRNSPVASFADEDTKDGDAPTRLSHAIPDVAAPTIVPATRGRAIKETNRGEPARTNLRDRTDRADRTGDRERVAKKENPPTKPPRAVMHRATVPTEAQPNQPTRKIEDTLPPVGEPEYTEPEAQRGLGAGILPGLIFFGLAVIIVLIVMLFKM
jgi:hypothetical protein